MARLQELGYHPKFYQGVCLALKHFFLHISTSVPLSLPQFCLLSPRSSLLLL